MREIHHLDVRMIAQDQSSSVRFDQNLVANAHLLQDFWSKVHQNVRHSTVLAGHHSRQR